MKARRLATWGVLGFVFCRLVSAHDVSASYATIRIPPERLELQVKIAAEMAWPLVQASVAPGKVFVLEEFETVGRELLVKFAQSMEELTVGGTLAAPTKINAEVVEDNFVFTFTFPRPAGGQARLTEKYLQHMPSDYVSRVVVLDDAGKPQASKTIHPTNFVFEFAVPPIGAAKISSTPPPGSENANIERTK